MDTKIKPYIFQFIFVTGSEYWIDCFNNFYLSRYSVRLILNAMILKDSYPSFVLSYIKFFKIHFLKDLFIFIL